MMNKETQNKEKDKNKLLLLAVPTLDVSKVITWKHNTANKTKLFGNKRS
jgi:hypothetical protein